MIQLLILDVDGTLIPSGSEAKPLSDDILTDLDLLSRRGIRLAAASERPFRELEIIFSRIARRMYFLAGSDSTLLDGNGQALHWFPLSDKTVHSLLTWTEEFPQARARCFSPVEKDGIVTSIAVSCTGNIQGYFRYLNEVCHWTPDCQIETVSSSEALFSAGDKGLGVRALMEYLHIPLENVMYMGDSYNDLPALKLVGHPCVRDSAPAGLRKQFPCQFDNVYEILQTLLTEPHTGTALMS